MANIDSDDPLGDLLSDGSNDSFFEEPKMLAKRSSLVKTPDKKSITDLFGLDVEKSKATQGKEVDWLGLGESKTNPTEAPKTAIRPPQKLTKKISFDDDADILGSLSIDKNESQNIVKGAETVKKSSLIESIFGPPKPQAEDLPSFQDILKESKVNKGTPDETSKPIIQQNPRPSTPEGRRSRHQRPGSGILDPLGLFSSNQPPTQANENESVKLHKSEKTEPTITKSAGTEPLFLVTREKNLKTKSAPDIRDLPEWLAGQSSINTHKSETNIAIDRIAEAPKPIETSEDTENPTIQSLITQQKLATSHIEYQNTSIALQQQESQLLMALQLKKYEENLTEMQRKQQDLLVKQEQQFNSLLERQFAKQQILENNMRLQQERINNHIQMLISQPSVAGKLHDDEQQEEIYRLKKTNSEENSKLYEELISTLKQRQHEEVFLLNESYRKQIALLENSMESVENRMKTEFENLSKQFEETCLNLKKEHAEDIARYKTKLVDISNSHSNEIKILRDNHNRIVEELRFEYSTMIENMKQIKQTENSVVENASNFSQKLDSNLEVLDVNSKILNEIRVKVQQDYGIFNFAKEESLKAKEEEMRLMRSSLEKARASAESERVQLMGLVRSLETKLVEQNQNAREERWVLQQSAALLAARTTAFEREMQFAHSSLERERNQIKTLRESLLAEQESKMLQLTEEKLLLSAEKSRFETTMKLNQGYDAQKARTEIEAAMQVAKEATEMTDRERDAFYRQQIEIESLKRNLIDRGRKLSIKERELEVLQQHSKQKMQEGERAIAEAKTLEAQYNSRLRHIQDQLAALACREKKLADDKIAFSKERLASHTNLRQIKKCSLCATNNPDSDGCFTREVFVEQDFSPRILTVPDPEILRLRHEINEERSPSRNMEDYSDKNKD